MPTPLPATTGCFGGTVGSSTPVQLTVPAGQGGSGPNRRYHRIFNAGPGALWLTRDPAATPAVGAASCWLVPVNGFEEFQASEGSFVPAQATFAISDSSCNVAVEVR